jgi:D-tyrosyl-tRNA(Tyr) deacylase
MRALIQRVTNANVVIDNKTTGEIGPGFVILLGIETDDSAADIGWLVRKIEGLRVFADAEGKMNLSLGEIDGGILVVSQFTLHASYKKGNRPGFTRAAKPDIAIPLYKSFIIKLEETIGKTVATGEFGADMKIHLVNDGPVTIMMDTKRPE